MSTIINASDAWGPLAKVAKCLHCSRKYLHDQGRAEKFGYRQTGPRLFEVCIPDVVKFYTKEYPNIHIDHKELESLAYSTA